MKRIPRYDSDIRVDLTKYGNFVYEKLWEEKGCPTNLVIGEHNLECYGKLRELRYGGNATQVSDNIHLRGKLGEAHFTSAVLRVFKLAFPFLQAYDRQILKEKSVKSPPRSNYAPMEQRQNTRRHSNIHSSPFQSPHSRYHPAKKASINPWQPAAVSLYNRFASLSTF